jgi:signal transduction histidine kinase
VRFSPRNTEITLHAELSRPYLRVDISDEGPGIPHQLRKTVFEPFFQGERPLRLSPAGVGLGLAICKGIVESHGGHIWIQDQPRNGLGTTNSFTLPISAG